MRARLINNLLPDGNSQVTMTLRDVLCGGMDIFDRERPFEIWDEQHRHELEQKIIDHYMFRQIGFETAARFKFELNVKLREVMPYYVKIFATTQYEYNPIENYTMKEGSEDITEGSEKGSGNNLSKYSDTPQGSVDRLEKYLTNAQEDISGTEREHKNKLTHTAHRNGNIGVTTSQQMIQAERDITLNIDMMIIDELQNLFLGVY